MRQLALVFLTLSLPLAALAQTPPDLVAKGDAKKVHGDFKGAIADYTQAIASDPKNIRAYLARASVLSLEGNYVAAIKDDTRALVLDPKNAIAYSNRGNARTSQGDLTRALADYTQAIALDPHHVRAFINRGNVKNLQKKYSAAIVDYTAAIALDPKNAAAFYDRGGAKKSIGDYAGAKVDYSEAISLNPPDVPAYINRAVLEMAQKNWSAATADLTKCLSLLPAERQAYPRIYLWVIAVKQGQTENATHDLADATKAGVKSLSETWGWQIGQYLTGQMDEATFLASAASFQAKQDKSQKAKAYYFAGLKREIAGDKTGAAKLFHQCIATGNPSLHEYILAQEELKP